MFDLTIQINMSDILYKLIIISEMNENSVRRNNDLMDTLKATELSKGSFALKQNKGYFLCLD